MTVIQWVLLFYVYCFLGWIWETLYVSVREKKFCNRGFLHGPFLPIYGSGAIIILLATYFVRENILLVYVLGMIAATVLEYFTGETMQRIFGVRYWDYSEHRFNLNGHICLFVSLAWGIFSVLLVRFINPPIMDWVLLIPHQITEAVTTALTVAIAADGAVSVNEALDLKKVLKELAAENEDLRRLQKRADVVYAFAEDDLRKLKENIDDRIDETLENMGDKREELADRAKTAVNKARERLAELNDSGEIARERFAKILKRNPGAVSSKLKEELAELKKILN